MCLIGHHFTPKSSRMWLPSPARPFALTFHRHLKPGTGWLEQVEIDLQPRCDDGSMPHAPMVEWYDHLRDATKMLGRPIQYPHNTEEMLKRAGFVDVNHTVHMVPFNTWPADDNQKKTGRRYCACLLQAIEALSLQPMTKAFGWSVEEIRPMLTALGRAIMNRKVHAYNNVYDPDLLLFPCFSADP